MENGIEEIVNPIPQNEARFVEKDGKFQLQCDVHTFIKDDKRRNVLANLILNDLVKLEYTIAKASADEIEELYDQFNPKEKKLVTES